MDNARFTPILLGCLLTLPLWAAVPNGPPVNTPVSNTTQHAALSARIADIVESNPCVQAAREVGRPELGGDPEPVSNIDLYVGLKPVAEWTSAANPIVAWIFYEAFRRFLEPVEILGGAMMVVGVLGLAVNVVAFLILHGAETANLNIHGATVHVLGDLFGSIGAIAAAGIILWTGWTPIDPILSVVIGLLILRSAWFIVTDSAHILLQGTPQNIDIDRISAELRDAIPEVQKVHHVHA